MIELLAPAKNPEIGKAAILSGADAVYIGADKFGARVAAGNRAEDIRQLADFAHAYFAKVYITVNTLFYDHELAEVEELCYRLYEAGADAFIIQDPALLRLNLPPVALHASTQMHNHTAGRINFLHQAGIERVVLARELTIEQIKSIKQATRVELEAFIHGSLCVCYSGRCFMSEAIGGRSANRGECAQPCRKKYALTNEKGNVLVSNRHLLSLRDLNQTDNIGRLLDAGVSSFKIEGRLKDIDYVKNITAWYRQVIDRELAERPLLKRASSGKTTLGFRPDPYKSFNRGYTSYFSEGRQEKITNHASPKSLGKPAVTVTGISGRKIQLATYTRTTDEMKYTTADESELSFANGDGLCWYDNAGNLHGSYINNVQGLLLSLDEVDGLKPGTVVMRNFDKRFAEQLLRPDSAARKIDLQVVLDETGEGILLSAMDEDGVTTEVSANISKIPATSPRARETMKEQISKSGGTIFNIVKVELRLTQDLFMQAAFLNNLRRELLDKALSNRLAHYQRSFQCGGKHDNKSQTAFGSNAATTIQSAQADWQPDQLTGIENITNAESAAFYQAHGMDEKALNEYAGMDFRRNGVSAENYPLMTTKMCVKYELGKCRVLQKTEDTLPGKLFLDSDDGRFRLEFDCKACVMRIFKDN